MRLHLLGFPHLMTVRDNAHCAFTSKVRKMSTMLHRVGIEVVLYAGEDNEAECKEHVPLFDADDVAEWWPDYQPRRDVFNDFDPTSTGWRTFNARAAAAIHRRSEPGDILAVTMGTSQKPVADALPDLFCVEVGIGYSGVFAPYRVYESYAWRNYITGRYGPTDDVRFYDTVIPNFFETDSFPLGNGDGGYYLFLGRVMERKGVHIAAMACQRIGAKLVVAGQQTMDLPGDVEFVGPVGEERRAELLGGAIATFCPSIYLEPFCGVSVESQLCGTPVISTNWGALVENVDEAWRCDTLAEFARAAEAAQQVTASQRADIRDAAQSRWSTQVLAPAYADYFARIQTLRDAGWYS